MKIRNGDSWDIATNAAEQINLEAKRILKEERLAFGIYVYKKLATEKVFAQVAKLPDEWKYPRDNIHVKFTWENETKYGNFSIPDLPMPRCGAFELTGADVVKAKALVTEVKRLSEEDSQFRRKVNDFVKQFKTYEQLSKAWPQGQLFYPKIVVIEIPQQALMVVSSDINAKLGL